MYEIIFYDKAKSQLKKLPVNLRHRIFQSLERIKIRPYHFIKRKEGTPYFVFRVGDYRIILDIRKQKLIIFVVELGPRKKIYKK
jgi:mRNA interferase RelE/StbE